MASRRSALATLDDMFPTVSCSSQFSYSESLHGGLRVLIASVMLQIPTETIASVLQEHDGNVESTIEALLNVCSPAQSSKKVTILLTLNYF